MRWFVHGHIANNWLLLARSRNAGLPSPRPWFLHWEIIWPLPPFGSSPLLLTLGECIAPYSAPAFGMQHDLSNTHIFTLVAATLELVTLGCKKRQEKEERQLSAMRNFTSLSILCNSVRTRVKLANPYLCPPPCGWALWQSLLKLPLFSVPPFVTLFTSPGWGQVTQACLQLTCYVTLPS